jgi:DNA-binding NtrC family response regulator
VEEVERELILQTLTRCHGNRTSASGILGISVRTMRNKLRTFIEAGIAVAPAP